MRKTATFIVVLAVTASASFALPAVGAPNPLAVAKKALRIAKGANKTAKRSMNSTHATKVRIVDSGDVTAPPLDFARFDVRCNSGQIAVGANLALGALEPVFEGSYGSGMIVAMANPSQSSAYSGSIEVTCVWAAQASTAKAAGLHASPKADVLEDARSIGRGRPRLTFTVTWSRC